jgi:hypothetical protein
MPSPKVSKTPTKAVIKEGVMDFPDALRKVIDGKKITKLEWNDPKIYLFLDGGRLRMMKENTLFDLIVSDGDLLGTDWVIVED